MTEWFLKKFLWSKKFHLDNEIKTDIKEHWNRAPRIRQKKEVNDSNKNTSATSVIIRS